MTEIKKGNNNDKENDNSNKMAIPVQKNDDTDDRNNTKNWY